MRRGQGEGLGGIQGEGVGIHGDSRGFARIHEHSQTSVTTYGRRLTLLRVTMTTTSRQKGKRRGEEEEEQEKERVGETRDKSGGRDF